MHQFKSFVTSTYFAIKPRRFSTTPFHNMKIAITGARGTVGQEVVKLCAKAGHTTVQVDRTDEENNGVPNTEMRTADVASDYDATLKAFKGCEAVIHLSAIPNPVDKSDAMVRLLYPIHMSLSNPLRSTAIMSTQPSMASAHAASSASRKYAMHPRSMRLASRTPIARWSSSTSPSTKRIRRIRQTRMHWLSTRLKCRRKHS
jgi:D-arabinose 1-dehydrogenase-like Zn-dependent alcohol dehydrogenase